MDSVLRAPVEALGLALLLPEGLDHAERAQDFLDHAHRRTFEALHGSRALTEPRLVHSGKDKQHRAGGQRRYPELPVEGEDHVDHGD